jgi:hypothetical protein
VNRATELLAYAGLQKECDKWRKMQFRVKLIINGNWTGVLLLFLSSGRFINCWIYVASENTLCTDYE